MPKRTTFDLAGLDIISSTPGKAKYIPFVKAWSRVTIRLKTKPVSKFRYHPRFTHVVLTRGEVWTTLRAHRIPWRSHDEPIRLTTSLNSLLLCLLISILLPASALADNWQLQVGAQNGDRSHQAIAFLPNEIWIHSGDSITWAFPANDIHTVTFLTPLQVRPNRFTGCAGGAPPDGRTPDFAVYDGTACVNSGVLTSEDGQTYTVVFPVTGNFKLVCLVHPNMAATIHVLALPTALPHDQVLYDKEADRERAALLSDVMASAHIHSGPNQVTVGVGHIMGNGRGTRTSSVMRF